MPESSVSWGAAVRSLLDRFPPMIYERGEIVIENSLLDTTDFGPATGTRPPPVDPGPPPILGYVVEGLVRGQWNRNTLAPLIRATAIVAGDGRWIGADAFKFGKNLFRYAALTPTAACLVPLEYLVREAPRPLLLNALQCVAMDWCSTASLLSLGADTLGRRTLLLLFDMSRNYPRPELEVRQADIANMLGVTRQTLQPVLKGLENRGLISLGYAEIVIADPQELVRRLRGRR